MKSGGWVKPTPVYPGEEMEKSYTTADGKQFYQMMKMESVMWTGPDSVRGNLIENMKLGLPEIEYLPEYMKPKSEPLAIVGGGPSLRRTYHELKNFKNIIVAGSAHDWVVEHGIKPTYCLVLDPDPATCGYFKHPVHGCNYLVASQCVPKLFDILKDYQVTVWHAATNISPEEQAIIFNDAGWTREQIINKKPIIGGGCTTGSRCLSIAMFLGFKEFHLFGMDSNMEGDAHHAYDFADPENEWLGDIIEVNFGSRLHDEKSPTWTMARYMMLQLWSMSSFLDTYSENFSIEVHGESALKEFMRVRDRNIELLREKAA